MKNVYRIADVNFLIDVKYPFTEELFKDYLTSNMEVAFDASVTCEEIREEFLKDQTYEEFYYENVCLLRKINKILIEKYNGFVFHASTVAYKDGGFCYSAHSGTGKSTHATLLRKYLGKELTSINDDKPFIRYFPEEDAFYVYGSPWNGKHRLGNNVRKKLSAITFIKRAVENRVEKAEPKKVLPLFLSQVVYPENNYLAEKMLTLIDKLFSSIPLYVLHCNKELSAAEVSFKEIIAKNS